MTTIGRIFRCLLRIASPSRVAGVVHGFAPDPVTRLDRWERRIDDAVADKMIETIDDINEELGDAKERSEMSDKKRPVPTITPKMMHVIADLLDKAGRRDDDEFKRPDYLTSAEADALDLAAHTWNGDPEQHVPGEPWYSDSTMAHMFADACRTAAGPVVEPSADEPTARAEAEKRRAIERAERSAVIADLNLEHAKKVNETMKAELAALKANQ